MNKAKNTTAADPKPAATPPGAKAGNDLDPETGLNPGAGTAVKTETDPTDPPGTAEMAEKPGTPLQPDTTATPDTDELIRQAYLRGRNEAIDELMRRPAMLQPLDTASASRPDSAPASEIMILNSQRPSIWDK